jgi:hypothetical protein
MDSTKKRCAYSTCGEPVHFSTIYIRGAVFSYIRYKVVSKILCILCMLLAVLCKLHYLLLLGSRRLRQLKIFRTDR